MRVLERLEELYAIGDRIGYTPEEQRAHDLAAAWFTEAGLELEVDDGGNLIGRSPGGSRDIWTGSHLDTVPAGGRFDGALGVVAGLEAVERLRLPGLGVVVFRDEERGCAGSRFRARSAQLPAAYVELHIEQGSRLDQLGAPLAVVPGIVGYARGEITVAGRAGHAGTTPMDHRDDALVAAAQKVLAIRDAAHAIPDAVATVGRFAVEPGGVNVIPSSVTLTVDARAPDRERLDRLVAAIGFEPSLRVEPIAMDESVCAAARAALDELGVPVVELPSGAGHDAGILAAAGVPSAMIFVRSLNGGVSHSPDELSSPEDVALGVDALERTLARLAAA